MLHLHNVGNEMDSALAQESVTVCMKMPLNQKFKGFMKKGHIIKTQEPEYRNFHALFKKFWVTLIFGLKNTPIKQIHKCKMLISIFQYC